jgi:dTDP-4-amino-4,6-dideoxygalactose transaminase
MKIPISKILFDENDFAIVQEPLKSGWVVQGKFVAEFENLFSQFSNAKHSIAVSSCTTALHLALLTLDIKQGDEVIVPAFTWISTANAVEYVGATPVFCDIDLDTYNIDTTQLESKITPKTKAIIPVHLFGMSANMQKVLEISKKYNLKIVEDAACGFGTLYKQTPVGTIGDIGCFSFHPRKAITTGEGGMLTTNHDSYAIHLKTLRNHGASTSDFEKLDKKYAFLLSEYNEVGFNYRLTDIQGALGVTQMQKADFILQERQKKANIYYELLKDLKWLKLPYVPEYSNHAYQAYVCLFQPEELSLHNIEDIHQKRNKLMYNLEKKGIITRQGTHAVTAQGFYQKKYNIKNIHFPNAYIADRATIALPLYPNMTLEEQKYVVDNLIFEFKNL